MHRRADKHTPMSGAGRGCLQSIRDQEAEQHKGKSETHNSNPEQYMKCRPPAVSAQETRRSRKLKYQKPVRCNHRHVTETSRIARALVLFHTRPHARISVKFPHALFDFRTYDHTVTVARTRKEDDTGGTAISASDCSWIFAYHSTRVSSACAGMETGELNLEKSADHCFQ